MSGRAYITRLAICIVCAPSLFACSQVPDLEPTVESIPIYKIVERVKCEILDAVKDPLNVAAYAAAHHRRSRYSFLKSWTAKIDLTLIVNDQAGVSPNFSVIPTVPTAAQSFALGLVGGVTGQAIRTETLSFTLELRDELDNPKKEGNLRYYQDCILPHGSDLNGSLDLKIWLDSALSPLAPPSSPWYPYLTEGHHKPPAVGGGGGPKAEIRPSDYVPTLNDVLKAAANTAAVAKLVDDLAKSTAASQSACAAAVIPQADTASQEVANASNAAYSAGLAVTAAAGKSVDLKPYYEAAMTAFSKAQDALDAAKKTLAKCVAAASLDPPIDTISHSVQFIVTYTGGAAPSWTLVHFKGPAAAGSLLSGTKINTHTLVITMGAPAAGTTKAQSDEMFLTRQNQNTNAAIQSLGQQIRIAPF
jgi:hypothetical protein